MSKNYILKWSGGEINISSLGCINLTNPIHSRGVHTSLKFFKNQNWKTEYSFFVEKI